MGGGPLDILELRKNSPAELRGSQQLKTQWIGLKFSEQSALGPLRLGSASSDELQMLA